MHIIALMTRWLKNIVALMTSAGGGAELPVCFSFWINKCFCFYLFHIWLSIKTLQDSAFWRHVEWRGPTYKRDGPSRWRHVPSLCVETLPRQRDAWHLRAHKHARSLTKRYYSVDDGTPVHGELLLRYYDNTVVLYVVYTVVQKSAQCSDRLLE